LRVPAIPIPRAHTSSVPAILARTDFLCQILAGARRKYRPVCPTIRKGKSAMLLAQSMVQAWSEGFGSGFVKGAIIGVVVFGVLKLLRGRSG